MLSSVAQAQSPIWESRSHNVLPTPPPGDKSRRECLSQAHAGCTSCFGGGKKKGDRQTMTKTVILVATVCAFILHSRALFFFLAIPTVYVPRLGVESELQLPAGTTATAMSDPSRVCDLHCSSQQHQILNPLQGQGLNPSPHGC